ncbi:MAG TPA: hypothetical protein VH257_02150 [Chloroflexota bacterium]|nr:hypothetical protein [Chloroflexota bacterium]
MPTVCTPASSFRARWAWSFAQAGLELCWRTSSALASSSAMIRFISSQAASSFSPAVVEKTIGEAGS